METVADVMAGLQPWAVYLVLAALVFGESAAVVAVFMPGELALLAGGAAAATGYASLPLVVLVAVVAAIAGQALGYELGRRKGLHLLRWPVVRRYAGAIEATAQAVVRHGALALLLGRWTNVGRILVPMVVGAMRMRYRTFLMFNILGGIAWAVTFVLLGALAGASIGSAVQVVGSVFALLTAIGVAGLAYGLVRPTAKGRRQTIAHNDDRGSDDLRCSITLRPSPLPGRNA